MSLPILGPLRSAATTQGQILGVEVDRKGARFDLLSFVAATYLTGFDDAIRIAIEDPELAKRVRQALDQEVFPTNPVGDRTAIQLPRELREAER